MSKLVKCRCGCGKYRPALDKKGRPRFYIMGHQRRGKKMSDKVKRILLKCHLGKKRSVGYRKKLSEAKLGTVFTKEHRENISKTKLGKKNPQWKGGKTDRIKSLRCTAKYKEWRKSVFERDNYTCVFCGRNTGKKDKWGNFLNADHIKPISQYPKLIFNIDN